MGFYAWLNLKFPSLTKEQVIEKAKLAQALIGELLGKNLVRVTSIYVLESVPLIGVAKEIAHPLLRETSLSELASHIRKLIENKTYSELVNAEIVVNFYSEDAGNGRLVLHGALWRKLKGDIEIDLYEDRFFNLVDYIKERGMDFKKVFVDLSAVLKKFNEKSLLFTCSRAVLSTDIDALLTKEGVIAEFYNSPQGLARAMVRWLFATYEGTLRKVKEVVRLRYKGRERERKLAKLRILREKDTLADAAIKLRAVDMDVVIPRMASHEAFKEIIASAAKASETSLSWHSVVLVNTKGLNTFYRKLAERTVQRLARELRIDYLELIDILDRVLKG
ncbi:hypothetical protein DRP04_11570 [Archaeoglobales archaeon]|nr:MAG: hypothetical protein DRP04_11570 [Archaeoglobales archaeon]